MKRPAPWPPPPPSPYKSYKDMPGFVEQPAKRGFASHLIDAVYWLYALGDMTVRVIVYCWIILALVVLVTYLASSARLWMVGAAGLQPATPCLEGRCSMPLSYAPVLRARREALRAADFDYTGRREIELGEIDLSLGCPHGYKPLPFSHVCLWRLL